MTVLLLLVPTAVFVVVEVWRENVERCGPVRRPRVEAESPAWNLATLPLRRL